MFITWTCAFNTYQKEVPATQCGNLKIYWILLLVGVEILLYALHVYSALLMLSYACVSDIRANTQCSVSHLVSETFHAIVLWCVDYCKNIQHSTLEGGDCG